MYVKIDPFWIFFKTGKVMTAVPSKTVGARVEDHVFSLGRKRVTSVSIPVRGV